MYKQSLDSLARSRNIALKYDFILLRRRLCCFIVCAVTREVRLKICVTTTAVEDETTGSPATARIATSISSRFCSNKLSPT